MDKHIQIELMYAFIEVLLDGLDGGDLEKIKLYIENKLSTNNTPFNSFDELDEDELPF
jgi:hypothetical protein